MNAHTQFSTIAEDMHAEAAEHTDANGQPLMTDAEWHEALINARKEYGPRAGLTTPEHCEHAENDHGICLDCGKDVMDDLIAAAEYAADCAQDR